MLNRIREWTCEDCTDGLVKIAEMFAQPTFIEDSITFLQVTKSMVIMWKMVQRMQMMQMKMMKMMKMVKMKIKSVTAMIISHQGEAYCGAHTDHATCTEVIILMTKIMMMMTMIMMMMKLQQK